MQLTHTLLLAVLSLTSLSAAQYHNPHAALAARDALAESFYDDNSNDALYARDADLEDFLYARDLYARAGGKVSEADLLRKLQQNKGEKCRKNCTPMASHSSDAYEDCYHRCMGM
ncbi:hypothetical protein MMC17_007215 [Xylographa soralifera]|nr:hypothetical protein [Xylographa soralifera]